MTDNKTDVAVTVEDLRAATWAIINALLGSLALLASYFSRDGVVQTFLCGSAFLSAIGVTVAMSRIGRRAC